MNIFSFYRWLCRCLRFSTVDVTLCFSWGCSPSTLVSCIMKSSPFQLTYSAQRGKSLTSKCRLRRSSHFTVPFYRYLGFLEKFPNILLYVHSNETLFALDSHMLDPNDTRVYAGSPYPFGLDPVSSNQEFVACRILCVCFYVRFRCKQLWCGTLYRRGTWRATRSPSQTRTRRSCQSFWALRRCF